MLVSHENQLVTSCTTRDCTWSSSEGGSNSRLRNASRAIELAWKITIDKLGPVKLEVLAVSKE